MFKSKGQINKQGLGPLAEAQLQEQDSKPGFSTPPPPRKQKRPRQRKTFHTIWLYVALALMAAGVGYGLWSGAWVAGNVAVDELTSVNVLLNINSQPEIISTNCATVEEFLNEQRIRLEAADYIGQDLSQPLTDGMTIWLRLSIPISIVADGQTYLVESQPITVKEALEKAGVTLTPKDEVNLPLLKYIYEATEIKVSRVRTEVVTENESIPPGLVSQEFTYLTPGSNEVISPGKEGVRRSTYEVIYRDDEEISRKLLTTLVVSEPVDEILGYGPAVSAFTAVMSGDGGLTELMTATTESGASFYYTQQFTVETTAYTWTGNRTFTGTVPKVGTVAVDPAVIPLGTKVYIVGYGFATAEDTGGAVKGNIVDLYMDTEQECINWGRRHVAMYVLAQ